MGEGFFIRNRVLTLVLSFALVLAGVISILVLPIAKLPPVLPPTVEVRAIYPGASAEVVEATVTTWLEEAINGSPGMIYISSESNDDGGCNIIVTFELGYDIDTAELNVLNRVATVTPRLPEEVQRMGVSVRKVSANLVLSMMLYDKENKYDSNFLSNYAQIYMLDDMARVPGVGAINYRGQRIYAMRVWLDPNELATRQLTTTDVIAAIKDQNLTIPGGATGLPPAPDDSRLQLSVNMLGRLSTVEEFENIVIKPGPENSAVRLGDVAQIELGATQYNTQSRFDGHESVAFIFEPVPGANLVEMVHELRATVDELSKDFPPGLLVTYPFDESIFISAAVRGCIITLLEAVVLVGIVIFIFLRDWRSTLIPMVTIPTALLGTFALMQLFGFSINLLTLFGLTLATGLVVDDAIVVIENISRIIKEKAVGVMEATITAMREIKGAVIGSTLSLIAVFVPVGFFPGVTGQIYRQFSLTIACSIALSLFAALTLAPALAAVLLKKEEKKPNRVSAAMGRGIDALTSGYERALKWSLARRWYVVGVFAGLLAVTVLLFETATSSFLPPEDQGYFVVNVRAPSGTGLYVTQDKVDEVTATIDELPGVESVMSLTGFSMIAGNGSNYGTIFVNLKLWDERDKPGESSFALIKRLDHELKKHRVPGWSIMGMSPPSIQGLSPFGGFQFVLELKAGGPLEELARVQEKLVRDAKADPRLRNVFSNFSDDNPELYVDIDREQALTRGISLQQVFETLQVYLGSMYVNDFNLFGRVYQVFVQAKNDARAGPGNIPVLYVRAGNGEMVSLRNLVNIVPTNGAQSIPHYNLNRSALIQGNAAVGLGSEDALEAMEELAEKNLPSNMLYEWTGMTYQQIKAGNLAAFVFLLGLLFVYLVLAGLYGSFAQPLIIMLAIPVTILGALLALRLRGLPTDAYTQVGFVMLIGLATKNGILIVEVANQLRAEGHDLVEAVVDAGRLRLRPILMTALAFIIGIFPMAIATGAGAASRISIGTTVIGGMVVTTVVGLFFVPIFYVIIERLREGRGAEPNLGGADDGPALPYGDAAPSAGRGE